jgi:hypothetical protein
VPAPSRRQRRLGAALAVVAIGVLTACGEADDTETSDRGAAVTEASDASEVRADDIPVAYTPPGGYGEQLPDPILSTCTEPLVSGAPDLRGYWQVVAVEVAGASVEEHPAYAHTERVEQCGDRLVVTGGGIIHDMRCDGTEERGVHDVAAADLTTRIDVVATYEEEVHVLRPIGLPVEITRRLDGEQMVWDYPGFTARLERTDDPADLTT